MRLLLALMILVPSVALADGWPTPEALRADITALAKDAVNDTGQEVGAPSETAQEPDSAVSKPKRGPWSRGVVYGCLGLFAGASAADAFSTEVGIRLGATEQNPVVREVIEKRGLNGLWEMKLVAVPVVAGAVAFAYEKFATKKWERRATEVVSCGLAIATAIVAFGPNREVIINLLTVDM